MAINIYLYFNGNCREAVEYYAQVFGTDKPKIMTYGEAPAGPEHTIPEEAKNLVMHAQLMISGSKVMFSDTYFGKPFTIGNNIGLTIVSKDQDEITFWYHKMKEDSTVVMELQETFWSKCYGSLVDKYGIEWQLSHDNGENET